MEQLKDIMRRFFAISLVAMFLLPSGVLVFHYQHQRYTVRKKVKRQMEKGLSKDQLVRLAFTETQKKGLRWEHSKEFEYRGMMYDIVYQENKADSTIYWCWEDHEETALNRKLEHLVQTGMDKNPEKKKQARLINQLIWGMAAQLSEIPYTSPLQADDLLFCPYWDTYSFDYFSIIDPPPRCRA